MCWTTERASGRLAVNHSTRAMKSGSRAIVSGPSVVTAASGSSPTTERARSGTMLPVQVEHVVVEAVLLVPQALLVQRVRDQREVLEELRRQVLVGLVVVGEEQRELEQVLAVHRHPGGAVGLLEAAADRQRRAVERADVVEAEEAALEEVVALGVLAVHPPGEVEEQLVEDPLEEVVVLVARDLVDAQRGPGVHRRVDVAERPLVRGQLAVRVHVPLAAQQDQLRLRELGVDVRERDAVEGEVPGRVPRVLPLVGHGDDVHVVQVRPLVVAAAPARVRRRRAGGVALEPARTS